MWKLQFVWDLELGPLGFRVALGFPWDLGFDISRSVGIWVLGFGISRSVEICLGFGHWDLGFDN